jgi:hypothetical protein
MRLGGWQRIGIVASVVWFIFGGIRGNMMGIEEGDVAVTGYSICLDSRTDTSTCSSEFEKNYKEDIKYHWWYAVIFGLVPIPIAWGIVYGARWVVRWIKAGFKASKSALPAAPDRSGDEVDT